MLKTKTGSFPLGLRRGGGWQNDLPSLVRWAKDNQLSVIDLGRKTEDITTVREAGLQVGSVDLLEWQPLFSSDAGKRRESVAKNAEYITQACAAGAKKFFLVVLPEDPAKPRAENFGYAVESFNALSPALEAAGGQLVIEGWPGPGALCCTPETYRATFKECPSLAIGINYDPSHLLRMGIDPLRFLNEFASRVGHVHGKDTEILPEDLYEYGWEQAATFKKSPAFGAAAWRYTIPGAGGTNWGEVFRILQENNYGGAVCIELEDKDYNGSEDGEKRGFISGAQYLSQQ
jgi:sugar phosphate isomerase/epimerase